MIYTSMTIKAMKIAYEAHEGQVDKSGVPYIFHPYHLAEQMEDEISVCAALLHDVLEDTEVTLKELQEIFPEEVTKVVELLTCRQGDDYFEYIERIRENPVACRVKLADLEHNSDETRMTDCKGEAKKRMILRREKYKKAKEILLTR